VLPFLILGVQIFVRGAKPPAAPLGDVIGAVKPSQTSGAPGSFGFAGHFATGFKWLSSQLI